jgi:hypothetical protein
MLEHPNRHLTQLNLLTELNHAQVHFSKLSCIFSAKTFHSVKDIVPFFFVFQDKTQRRLCVWVFAETKKEKEKVKTIPVVT